MYYNIARISLEECAILLSISNLFDGYAGEAHTFNTRRKKCTKLKCRVQLVAADNCFSRGNILSRLI